MESFDIDNNKEIYKLKSGEYKKLKILGQGTFGKVLLVQKVLSTNPNPSKEDSYYFALKISKKWQESKKGKKTEKEEAKHSKEIPHEINFVELRELTILKKLSRLNHINVLHMIDYKLEPTETWILMEYIHTDLNKFFYSNKDNPNVMNEMFFKNIAYQIISGINHLHSQQIIHRDIKLDNILYDDKKNIAKIGDFGLSRIFDYNLETKYTNVGTLPYQPPEMLLGLRKYSIAVDIWPIGCILIEICTMRPLFAAENDLGVLKLMYDIFGSFNDNVLPGYRTFPNANLISNLPEKEGSGLVEYIKKFKKFEFKDDKFFDLIKKMLCIDPTRRISAKDCLKHEWFTNSE